MNEFPHPGGTSRITAFGRFAAVARSHYALMKEVTATYPIEPTIARDEDGPNRTTWDVYYHELAVLEEQADEHATITIIFACAACEYEINDLAARRLGDTYFEEHVEWIDLLSKWILVPRLINGHQIDRGGRAYQLLKQLIESRNGLMHPKSKPYSLEQFRKDAEKEQHKRKRKRKRTALAAEALEALDRLAEECACVEPSESHRLRDPDDLPY